MTIEHDYQPVYVQSGDRIVIDVPGGRDEVLAWDTTVADQCENSVGGQWYCDTCRKGAPHNLAIQGCAEKGHRLAWICWEHGPETVRPS
jgi:hypothetical protein